MFLRSLVFCSFLMAVQLAQAGLTGIFRWRVDQAAESSWTIAIPRPEILISGTSQWIPVEFDSEYASRSDELSGLQGMEISVEGNIVPNIGVGSAGSEVFMMSGLKRVYRQKFQESLQRFSGRWKSGNSILEIAIDDNKVLIQKDSDGSGFKPYLVFDLSTGGHFTPVRDQRNKRFVRFYLQSGIDTRWGLRYTEIVSETTFIEPSTNAFTDYQARPVSHIEKRIFRIYDGANFALQQFTVNDYSPSYWKKFKSGITVRPGDQLVETENLVRHTQSLRWLGPSSLCGMNFPIEADTKPRLSRRQVLY